MQLVLVLFIFLLFLLVRHFWRHREIYRRIYDLFSGFQTPDIESRGREKRIVACPHCGSTPELTGEPCSRCGRRL